MYASDQLNDVLIQIIRYMGWITGKACTTTSQTLCECEGTKRNKQYNEKLIKLVATKYIKLNALLQSATTFLLSSNSFSITKTIQKT